MQCKNTGKIVSPLSKGFLRRVLLIRVPPYPISISRCFLWCPNWEFRSCSPVLIDANWGKERGGFRACCSIWNSRNRVLGRRPGFKLRSVSVHQALVLGRNRVLVVEIRQFESGVYVFSGNFVFLLLLFLEICIWKCYPKPALVPRNDFRCFGMRCRILNCP